MQPGQFSLRRMLLAVGCVAIGVGLVVQLETPSRTIFIAGSIMVGTFFGAAVGLVLNKAKSCTLIGAAGWLLFAVYAVLA